MAGVLSCTWLTGQGALLPGPPASPGPPGRQPPVLLPAHLVPVIQVICMKKEDFLHSPYVAKHGSAVDLTHIFLLVGDPSASQAIRGHGAGGVEVRLPVQPPHKGK